MSDQKYILFETFLLQIIVDFLMKHWYFQHLYSDLRTFDVIQPGLYVQINRQTSGRMKTV